MPHLPDAIIFDMDGLLVDTERFSFEAFKYAIATHGLEEMNDLFRSLVGTNEHHHSATLQKKLSDRIDPVAFRKTWVDYYKQSTETEIIPLLPGVIETLRWLKTHDVKTAVATSSTTAAAERKLTDTGISNYFMTVVCGDQVERSKPHPDIYLKAGKAINANMENSIGLEDSVNGVKSAHAAGLKVIQIPNVVPPAPELSQLGITVCDSMHDVLNLLETGNALQPRHQ